MIDKRLDELYRHTLLDIDMQLHTKWNTRDKNRILMIESAIERYHEKRYFITGRYNGQRSKDRRKNKKLAKINRALQKQLSIKWWQFWKNRN